MHSVKSILLLGTVALVSLAPATGLSQLITQAPPPPVPVEEPPPSADQPLSLDAPTATPADTQPTPVDLAPPPPPAPATPTQPTPVPSIAPPAPPLATPAPLDPPTAPDSSATPALPAPDVPVAPSPQDLNQAPPLPAQGAAQTVTPSTPRTFEFQDEDVPTVLRLLARQAGINVVVSDLVQGLITLRLQDVTALQAINVIVTSKGLVMDTIDNVYYIKTAGEKAAEPTESQSYTFSFARAEAVAPLLANQLQSKATPPQVDPRTNTIFYREAKSNLGNIRQFLAQVDVPTKQVMIEARLVETAANPVQAYGINWGGVVGSASNPTTIAWGGTAQEVETPGITDITNEGAGFQQLNFVNGTTALNDVLRVTSDGFRAFGGQLSVLSIPQMSITLRLLNEDADAEFLANPRIVTADNQEATIRIVTQRPVPSLNFNEQTATAEFGGFDNYEFGTTLVVRPSVNKNNFITLAVRPEISNSNQDVTFAFGGAVVSAPVIDTRSLESNVLIKSGYTLAIGGLLQDQTAKARSKVPVAGDIPILGYLFQERISERTKRNLLIFITPTVLETNVGTGLEDQVYGLRYSGEEFADPNGWLNNARGVYRMVPTEERSIAAEYPVPGIPQPPRFQQTANPRE